VKRKVLLKELISFVESQGISIDDNQKEQLEVYKKKLLFWNRKHNLVSRNEEPNLVSNHFLASFLYVYFLINSDYSKEEKLVDIGSGGGFPAIIISIYYPDRKIVLIESIRKKALFLKSLIRELNLNAAVIHGRIEEQEKNQFDIITARALAGLDLLDNYANHLLFEKGKLLTLKGDDYELEIVKNMLLSVNKLDIPTIWEEFSEGLLNKKMVVMEKN
jgi:16S rRNA (guanine527-N7)-methyltransferase